MRLRAKYVSLKIGTACGVADRWRASYFVDHGNQWREGALAGGKTAKQIYDALCKLGEHPTLATVAEVIGNKSWSYISCDGCNEHVERAVIIGDGEYSDRKCFCRTCLREALAVLDAPVETIG